jgi:hypothetical protein
LFFLCFAPHANFLRKIVGFSGFFIYNLQDLFGKAAKKAIKYFGNLWFDWRVSATKPNSSRVTMKERARK